MTQEELPDTPFWPDCEDPLGQEHGLEKVRKLEYVLLAAMIDRIASKNPEIHTPVRHAMLELHGPAYLEAESNWKRRLGELERNIEIELGAIDGGEVE